LSVDNETMKTPNVKLTRTLLALVAAMGALPAHAALLDRGPQDPTLVFPQWYRDLSNVAVGMCTSQAQSPNPLAGLKPMCFPATTDPTGFPGNLGPELFYNDLTVSIQKGNSTFSLKYLAALEASYIPAGQPVHGTEAVFARIRVVANTTVAGTYTVTHPFGIQVFPNVQPGVRSIFFTVDVPFGTPLNFDTALTGPIGPWIQWDIINAGESLTVGAQTFLGDPNYAHTYKGSPFGTNYVRVDGPPGSNLDGAGNDFVVEPLGVVVGQLWTAPIATKFQIQKAVYSRNATLNSVDVWATSAPAQQLILTGVGMPSLQLAEFPAGNYYGHVEFPAAIIPPASVTLTNMTSVPVTSVSSILADQIDAFTSFNPATRVLSVTATSSDLSLHTLSVLGTPGGLMTASATPGTYTFSGLLPAGTETPIQVRVESNAGGVYQSNDVVGTGAPMNPAGAPVAVNDAPIVAGAGPTTFDVSLNDTFSGAVSVLILTQPTTGSAVAAATGGLVTYTPNPGVSGPDSFTYVLKDAIGVSNVATVSFNVTFVAPAPTANADNNAMLANTSKILNVLANDVAGTGTTIDPASVVISTPAGRGVARANLDGTITYTPNIGVNSILDTFSYTVANTLGTRSAPAVVTIDIFGGPEAVSIGKALFTVSKTKWNIVGSTNWFNAALTQATATCWLGTAPAPTATTFIGTAPIDTTGKFAVVPVGTGPVPPNPSSVTCQTSYGGSKAAGVTFQ
jgi:hypothetical protein